ncbi:structure-specific endonuclease subunit SLX4 [Achroia grisella]|uniref:structure-specific endonuclease subunit SLX4 n=1 Tax=Achroia grisella TaxID=688607 RepID=UPI0027D27A8E|nr:structure-specific endonuclease subunit SLX4 [Achroia grisella]
MNISNYYSYEHIQCKVTSKYFSSCGMDESLSDFQEKKKCFEAVKIQKTIKTRKKQPKLIRGQRKIKSLLNTKKNELVSYSKDFDNICKQSGIDVDPEQLQLAVALSKSLQPVDNTGPSTSQLNTQGRSAKIRSTLQEYGFSVPVIKISNPNKRLKKIRRNYKLLLSTDAEKQQVITDKYSQVLFENIDNNKNCSSNCYNDFSDVHLYYLSTNAAYNDIRSNDVFYVSNLAIEKSTPVGSLLKDWSKIPGRPISPKPCENKKIDTSKILCSEDELDIILSGSLKCAQNIVSRANRVLSTMTDIGETDCCTNKANEIKINLIDETKSEMKETSVISNIDLVDNENIRILKVSQPVRSCSPDLFDDDTVSLCSDTNEVTILKSLKTVHSKTNEDIIEIIDCSHYVAEVKTLNTVALPVINCTSSSQSSQKTDNLTRKSYDPMELTECIALEDNFIHNENKSNILLSSLSNITKRKSNDFMDLTECLAHYSEPKSVLNENEIDLTQNYNNNYDIDRIDKNVINDDVSNNVDLTQSSNSNDSLPFVQVSGNVDKSCDYTIILNNSEISQSQTKKKKEKSTDNIGKENLSLVPEVPAKMDNKLANESFFKDYNYNHSDDDIKCNSDIYNNKFDTDDLTQSTDSEECNNEVNHNNVQSSYNKINDENIHEMSIDYDNVCLDNNMHINRKISTSNDSSLSNSHIHAIAGKSPEKQEIQSSQNSEAFEISDRELDYSLHKSRYDESIDINFPNLSTMNIVSNNTKNYISDNNETQLVTLNRSMSDSFLPVVNIKRTIQDADTFQTQPCNSTQSTPEKTNTTAATLRTPTNDDYIVKVQEVTPRLDYASMTTPERNQELDKYGLKPFKRKRAIQLLTHIYNQTHPVIASYANEELPSPSKKRKTDTNNPHSVSPKRSPLKPAKTHVEDVKENIYQITKDIPDLREIECSSEDWVLQKKEKARVHSSRVPLHIAFNNYLSCRRGLREAILRYEPVNIDIIHKELVACGHRYDAKDLLRFMDKRCITVKTSDNNSRNNKK